MASPSLGADAGDSDLMNYAVRMVIPMRREFGHALDVPHFLHDFTYAREVLEQAKGSQDSRLREYAAYLESKMFGPRNGPAPAPAAAAPAVTAPVAEKAEPSEEELRQRMLQKYKGSLR